MSASARPVDESGADVTDLVDGPRLREVVGLFEPDNQRRRFLHDDVKPPVLVEVVENDIHSGQALTTRLLRQVAACHIHSVLAERRRLPSEILEPEGPRLGAAAAEQVPITVAVHVDRFGVDGHSHPFQDVLFPGLAVERVFGQFEPGDFLERESLACKAADRRALLALVRRGDFRLAVAVDVDEEGRGYTSRGCSQRPG